MFRSYEVSSINTVIWSFVVAILYAHDWKLAHVDHHRCWFGSCFQPIDFLLSPLPRVSPVKEIVNRPRLVPATTILSGLSVGMESSVWALLAIVIAFIGALFLYGGSDPLATLSPDNLVYVLYAVAMIGIGMLSHTGNNVAMDSYGPISDNANGIGEMAWHDENDEETIKARQIMADLDAVGNTTKAITKGVAIASAVIAAVSLFSSYITDVGNVQANLGSACT